MHRPKSTPSRRLKSLKPWPISDSPPDRQENEPRADIQYKVVEDVKLAVEHKVPVEHFGRTGGSIHTPEELVDAIENKIIKHGHIRNHPTRESSIL